MSDTRSLGDLLRDARTAMGGKQESVAADLQEELRKRGHNKPILKQMISSYETGKCQVPLDYLPILHSILVGERNPQDLRLWLIRRLESEAKDSGTTAIIREAFPDVSSGPRFLSPDTLSLEDFPAAFSPLRIICGDRREDHPEGLGDLFAYPVSITDVMYLLNIQNLPSDVQVRSDKVLTRMPREWLIKEFGEAHLLVIGSPAVNLASRAVNQKSIFRFNLGPEISNWQNLVDDPQFEQLNDPAYAEVFQQMALTKGPISVDPSTYGPQLPNETLKGLRALRNKTLGSANESTDIRTWLNEFRKAGLLDPADEAIHGKVTRMNNDFGVISIAANPFAKTGSKFVAILAGGIHGPGTATAVKALAECGSGKFARHKLGGVIEVTLNTNAMWADKLEGARWKWETRDYDISSVRQNLFKSAKRNDRNTNENEWFSKLSDSEIQSCIDLIDALAKSA